MALRSGATSRLAILFTSMEAATLMFGEPMCPMSHSIYALQVSSFSSSLRGSDLMLCGKASPVDKL
jgi:hypothetical protein